MLAMIMSIPAFSQKQNGDKEAKRKEMMEFKLDYLAKAMELRDDQKKQFYEVYTQMENERRAIVKSIKSAEKKIAGSKNASEADYDKASKEISAAKAKMAQIEKKYDDKFASFLTKKQIYKMKEAANEFNEKMRGCRDKKKAEHRQNK